MTKSLQTVQPYLRKTAIINDGYEFEIYVDKNLIEVFINNGEYVISHVVYGLTDEVIGKAYTLYTTE